MMQFDKKSSDGLVKNHLKSYVGVCLTLRFIVPPPGKPPKKTHQTPDQKILGVFSEMEPVNLEMVLKPVVNKKDKVPTSTTVGFLNQQKTAGFLQKLKIPQFGGEILAALFRGHCEFAPENRPKMAPKRKREDHLPRQQVAFFQGWVTPWFPPCSFFRGFAEKIHVPGKSI